MTTQELLIRVFLKLNPNPTDKQYHALAYAVNIDQETLEACAYEMLSDELNDDTIHVLADVDVNDLTMVQKVLTDNVPEDFPPYYDSSATDGTRDPSPNYELQDITFADGGLEPYDQSSGNDDGVVTPNFKQLLSRLNATRRK